MNYQEEKLGKKSHLQLQKKKKPNKNPTVKYYLGINLTKEMKTYTLKNMTLMRETEKDK